MASAARAAARGPGGGRRGQGAVLAAAEHVAPGAGAWLAARAARRVPPGIRSRAVAVAGGEVTVLPGRQHGELAGTAEACGDGPAVYLLPGYHGKGHMRHLVAPLVGAGYRTVTVGVPAHHPEGPRRYRRGIVTDYVAALEAAVSCYGSPAAVIGHSIGGYAAQLAVLGGPLRTVPCLVLIEALPDAASIAAELARRAGLGPRTAARLPGALARQAGLTAAGADAAARAREDDYPRRVLVAWDDSSFIPASVSIDLACAWAAEAFCTSGGGHTRVLADPALHARLVEHLAGPGQLPSAGRRRAARW